MFHNIYLSCANLSSVIKGNLLKSFLTIQHQLAVSFYRYSIMKMKKCQKFKLHETSLDFIKCNQYTNEIILECTLVQAYDIETFIFALSFVTILKYFIYYKTCIYYC